MKGNEKQASIIFNGILIYIKNRLIGRFENKCFGELNYFYDLHALAQSASGSKKKSPPPFAEYFDNYGYIILPPSYNVNIFKTVR